MIAVLINTAAILLGGLIGLLLGRALPERLSKASMTALGLCTVYIGITGSLQGENPLVLIPSMVIGALLGTLINIDLAVQKLGERAQALTRQQGGRFGEGFVTASLLFCVGAMAITGSLSAGLSQNYDTLYAKSALDFVAAAMLASTLGAGVLLAALSVLVYQGAIVLLSGLAAPFLTPAAIKEMTCAGSLIILALGLNLLHITKIKVADLLPAIFLAPLMLLIVNLF